MLRTHVNVKLPSISVTGIVPCLNYHIRIFISSITSQFVILQIKAFERAVQAHAIGPSTRRQYNVPTELLARFRTRTKEFLFEVA